MKPLLRRRVLIFLSLTEKRREENAREIMRETKKRKEKFGSNVKRILINRENRWKIKREINEDTGQRIQKRNLDKELTIKKKKI